MLPEAASMNRQVLPQAGWEIEVRSQDTGSFSSPVRKHTSFIKLTLISLRKLAECSKHAVSCNFSLLLT